jgi:hypothetical protein
MFILTPRLDKPVVVAPGWTLATRIHLPFIITDAVSNDAQAEAAAHGIASWRPR